MVQLPQTAGQHQHYKTQRDGSFVPDNIKPPPLQVTKLQRRRFYFGDFFAFDAFPFHYRN